MLPTDNADLEVNYTAQDKTDVSTKNDVRVGQNGAQETMIHQFKDYVGTRTNCRLEWQGQSTLAASSSTIRLQIYNQITPGWETVASNTTAAANTDFDMTADISDLTNYKDGSNVISCRVYQTAL